MPGKAAMTGGTTGIFFEATEKYVGMSWDINSMKIVPFSYRECQTVANNIPTSFRSGMPRLVTTDNGKEQEIEGVFPNEVNIKTTREHKKESR